jgi:hypothetical protein
MGAMLGRGGRGDVTFASLSQSLSGGGIWAGSGVFLGRGCTVFKAYGVIT